jgi:hypothetical protein
LHASGATSTSQPQRSSVSREPRPGHRLDRRAYLRHRPIPDLDTPREPAQPIGVRQHRADLNALTQLVKPTQVQPLAAEIQSSVQHM